jgi:hypothetical protein
MIKAAIPGLAKDVIKVTMENGMLTLQEEHQQQKEQENKRFTMGGSYTAELCPPLLVTPCRRISIPLPSRPAPSMASL